MGQHLSEPVTTKETSGSSNSQYRSAATSMQGWRINMEDAHTQILSMKEDKDAAFFAVFDGHGGSKVAEYCGENLHKVIVQTDEYKAGEYVQALKKGFLLCDENMTRVSERINTIFSVLFSSFDQLDMTFLLTNAKKKHDEMMQDEMSGAAAVCVLIKDKKIYCSNSGDSRAVASVAGKVQELSFDHKPNNEAESRRIVAAGGWVDLNRVNGNLALSRAMGDFIFKRNSKKSAEEQIVTAYPDVIVKDMLPEHEFVVVACDGIWDVMSNQEVVDFVRKRIGCRTTPEQICEELLDHCLAPDCQMGGIGCDNMTAIVVTLLHEQSYEDLADRCLLPAEADVLLKYEEAKKKENIMNGIPEEHFLNENDELDIT